MESFDPITIYAAFFGSESLIAPEYLAATLLIAFVLYKWRRVEGSFWSWAVPSEIYRHRSTRIDAMLFVIGRVIGLLGILNRVVVASLVAVWVAGGIGLPNQALITNPWIVAAALLVLTDFITYWLHRAYHQVSLIWPIHAVHHSAEVLSPITAYRQHPLADILSVFVHSAGLGLAQGLLLGTVAPEFGAAEVAGVNAFFFLFAMLTANFRHSHVWISFGPLLEHIFISPAQHQIHHSVDPRHFNKNYGENLAVWDWMFGSLYIPEREEILQFGLSDGSGESLETPHPTLRRALVAPFVDMAEVASGRRAGAKPD